MIKDKSKSFSSKNVIKSSKIKINEENNSNNNNQSKTMIEIKDKEKLTEKKLDDFELNELSYQEAVEQDKRNFFQIYFSFLKLEHLLIKIFNSKDYNSLIIKIYLFFYNFNLNYAVNALFFNEGTIHQILEEEGKFNFLYQLPQILYSSIISYFFGMILENLALSENDILNFKAIRVPNIALKKVNKLIIIFSIKFFYFFFLSFVILLLFWYYVICFCAVYKNTQYHLIKDTIISFGTGLLTPLGTKILPVYFRFLGLKKGNKYLFLISKILQIFL